MNRSDFLRAVAPRAIPVYSLYHGVSRLWDLGSGIYSTAKEHYPPAYFSRETANHMMSATIKIGDTIIGLDKLEHFFQQGFWLFKYSYWRWDGSQALETPELRTKFNKWMEGIDSDATPAEKENFLTISHREVSEFREGYFGKYGTGIASNADINANNDGFKFYNELYDTYKNWTKVGGDSVFPFVFSFGDYKIQNWNEQNVKNITFRHVVVDDNWGLE
jgi:hypothetical protein